MEEAFQRCELCPGLESGQEKDCRRRVAAGKCELNMIVDVPMQGLQVRPRQHVQDPEGRQSQSGKMLSFGFVTDTAEHQSSRKSIETVKVNPEYL